MLSNQKLNKHHSTNLVQAGIGDPLKTCHSRNDIYVISREHNLWPRKAKDFTCQYDIPTFKQALESSIFHIQGQVLNLDRNYTTDIQLFPRQFTRSMGSPKLYIGCVCVCGGGGGGGGGGLEGARQLD